MQPVSQAWKTAHEQRLVPESYVEIVLNVGDPDAQADAKSASNGEEYFSDSSSLVEESEKNPIQYATLEKNIWVLDGTSIVVPDHPPYGENGYISEYLSGQDGSFEVHPKITISFSKVFNSLIPGLTITFGTAYGEYATSFKVTAYNGAEVVSEMTVANKEVAAVVYQDINGYDRIEIEILTWSLPYRRARIESIIVGIKKTYSKKELMSYSHSMSASPLSSELPEAEIEFEITNLNGEYNPDNPKGAEKYLMERQEIAARYGYELNGTIEWIKAGTFFMSEWDTPQNGITATFTARDSIEFMSDSYTGPSSGSLYSIAEAAFLQANLPKTSTGGNRWIISASLESINAPDDVDLSVYTIAETLQLVANASCCVFYQDREGILHIEPLSEETTDYEINRFNSYENSEISLTKQLKGVDVNNGAAVLEVGTVGETQKVDNPLISSDRATQVATWVAEYLKNRRTLSGNFRADPRLDVLDRVTNINQFATSTVLVTEVKYTYNGAFRGSYEGRSGV